MRVIAATRRDLRAMCVAGSFREDLWYRINVLPIRVPPLRERLGDVAPLARHFARRAGARLTGGGPLVPTNADIDALRAHSWPGNVRELAAVIERAAILGGGRRLEVGASLRDAAPRPCAPSPGRGERPEEGTLPTLDDAMRAHILRALGVAAGRIEGRGGAAEMLGVNPHTLRGKMRRLGVDWTAFRR